MKFMHKTKIILLALLVISLGGCGYNSDTVEVPQQPAKTPLENKPQTEDTYFEDIMEEQEKEAETETEEFPEAEDVTTSNPKEDRYDSLKKLITDEAAGDEIEQMIYEDFDGDGNLDMVAEAGRPDGDSWTEYYIFTNGSSTYRFGEYSNSFLYESQNMLLSVEDQKHLVNSSRWRAAALGGEMSHVFLFSIGSEKAETLFERDFARVDRVDDDKNIVYVSYHEVSGGEMERERGILYDTGKEVEMFYSRAGISPDYKSAAVQPEEDPQNVWKGQDVQEIVGNYGIHFYVPAEWKISAYYTELDDQIAEGLDYSADDGKGNTGWIINTCSYSFEGSSPEFDWAEGQYVYSIGNIGNEHYYICLAAYVEGDDPQYDPDVYFPELKNYRDMIGNTAWVE